MCSGFLIVVFVYVVEFIGMKSRTRAAIFMHSSFALGIMIVAVTGSLLKTWWLCQIVLSLATSPFMLCCWVLPETPFWLLSEGRYEEAQKVVDKMAKWNGKAPCQLSEVLLLGPEGPLESPPARRSHSMLGLFYDWDVGLKTTVSWLIWFTAALEFYCFSLMCLNMGGNKYLNLFLAGEP